MTWNGAGGWVIFSHDRQVNFSRTVWITFHCRGTTSSVSVIVSPSLASLPPQHGQAVGPGITTRSRGRCAGNGRPHRLLAGERSHRRAARPAQRRPRLRPRSLRSFLELQFQLVEQLAAALGGLPELLAPQLGDQQLVVGDHRLGAGGARLGLLPCLPLGGQRRLSAPRSSRMPSRTGLSHHAASVTCPGDGASQSVAASARGFRPPGTNRVPPVNSVKRPPTEIPLLLTAIFRERRRSRSPILGTRSMGGGSGC